MKVLRSLAAPALGLFLLMGAPASVRANHAPDRHRKAQLLGIEEYLRQNQWEAARQAAQTLTEALVERSGGANVDHRTPGHEAVSLTVSSISPEGFALAKASLLRAIAEAALNRCEESRWHWYIAQNIQPKLRSTDLSSYGKAGEFLRRYLLPFAAKEGGVLDVFDPVRSDGGSQTGFQEPMRTRVVYPHLPQDLRKRDRFSHVVFVQITVDASGQLRQPLLLDKGFYPGLVYRAFEALSEWRYRPARLDGRPIPVRLVVPVAFADARPSLSAVDSGISFPSFTILPTQITVNQVAGLSTDIISGALYAADNSNSVILRVERDGSTRRFGGIGSSGFNGDGRSALVTQFNRPTALSFDQRTAELFVADTNNYRIRVISSKDFRVHTAVGTGIPRVSAEKIPYELSTAEGLAVGRFGGDGGPAIKARLNLPLGVCADPIGILFIADSGNNRVRAVNRGTSPVIVMGVQIDPGNIQTIAGVGTLGYSGDGGEATKAQLALPTELKVDAAGNLLVVDSFNQRLRSIDRQSGIIRTVALGALTGITPERALASWSTSVVGVGITDTQEIIYTDRSDRSVHRVSPGGGNEVVYTAQSPDDQFADIEVGADGEMYLSDGHKIGVLLLNRAVAQRYFRGTTNSLPNFSGANTSSGISIE